MQLVDDIISLTSSPSYYHVAYATHAKLSLCAAQMDSMIHYNTHIDITPLFPNINTCIQSLTNIIQNNDISNDSYTEQAMIKVNKSVHSIRHSSNRLFEMSLQSKNTIDKDSSSPTPWDQTISSMASTLQQCSILILLHLDLIKKKVNDILLIFVDIMVLLAKIYFDANDDNTYYQAYDYLASAEQICSEHGLSSGYRWISATYYTLGAAMVTSSIIPSAVYPLRKACTLLEKDPGRISSDAGKLQLAKRYEVFGTCCQKNGDFEAKAAIKAFRMALKRVPATTVDTFTTGSERMSISRMIEQQPLVPKLMDRFLRSSIGEHEQRPLATELLDTSLITPIQQCVLYECELQILFKLSSRQNLMKQQNWFISSLLQHYTTEHYPIRRTR
ncbi:uncharacterized protein BX664DRAFT_259957 [Halteromyces radiatus]|uniref:uncharacterized protein n=1 Tax=Halteromyces radiatus TaxID=101107 RepID=UPI002220496B|nr:uncharacterized protein BX664DRAFT_259957 [Halteromyces radiatus]KAI8093675.1 hypothetical protein BX664DRAFT_259957 [Halteromyces radiatus]